jgi:hypothetical protein
MPLSKAQRVANTREHLTWFYRFALFWLVLSFVIFGGAYVLAELQEMSEATRTLMSLMIDTIIVTSAVWQAMALRSRGLKTLSFLACGVQTTSKVERRPSR